MLFALLANSKKYNGILVIDLERSIRFKSFLSQLPALVAPIRNFCSDQGCWFFVCLFFLSQFLQRISQTVSVTAVLKVLIIESMSVSSSFMMVRDANFPAIRASKVSTALGLFCFSRSNLSFLCFYLLILFRRSWKVVISKTRSFPMSAPGNLRVLTLFTPNQKRFLNRV